MTFFFSCNFFQFLAIKTLDPDWYQPKMLDPDLESMNPDLKHCLSDNLISYN
jgi:hypothetical protein